MEYQILEKIRHIPRWLRFVTGLVVLIIGIVTAILPVIPGGAVGIVVGLLLMVSARKVKKVRKIRRGLQHLISNFSWKKVRHKFHDIKKHLKHIIFHD